MVYLEPIFTFNFNKTLKKYKILQGEPHKKKEWKETQTSSLTIY